jgi:hypothetical protein
MTSLRSLETSWTLHSATTKKRSYTPLEDSKAPHANADAITWQEFQENFHAHHIPLGIMKLKKREFLSLT